MLNRLKLIPLITAAAFGLHACGDHDQRTAGAPQQLSNITATTYGLLRSGSVAVDDLFKGFNRASDGSAEENTPENNAKLCEVKVHRMSYGTVGGAGEATTSSGVFMLPHGDSADCSGERPVLMYAHGTVDEKSYDLSKFVPASDGTAAPSTNEGMLLLAAYASKGYAVIAPNYAGYADSTLGYHPYLDQAQQSSEMMHALDHVREHAATLGANLSSKLFITGLSQGGYVAMATHKALEASGETVTASMPVSGPYAMLDFIDRIFGGDVNDFATVFAPMALTALDKIPPGIYDNPSEVYASTYSGTAENSLPRLGGFGSAGLPAALFSGTAPATATNQSGFGANHLITDSYRAAYQADMSNSMPTNKLRAAVKALDLRDWTPKAPVLMCGADNDTIVYYENTTDMADYWSSLGLTAPLIQSLNLNAVAAGPYATAMQAFANANIADGAVHGSTGLYCAGAGLGLFGTL